MAGILPAAGAGRQRALALVVHHAAHYYDAISGGQPSAEEFHYDPPHYRPATRPADNRCGPHCPVPGGAGLRAIFTGWAERGGLSPPPHTQATTSTPEPAPTLLVTPDLSKLGVGAAAIIAFLSVPTPEADPGGEGVDSVGSNGLSNQDMSLATRSGNAVNGATGADTEPAFPSIRLPSLITVSISTLDIESTQSFLEANGGNIAENSLINTPPSWTFVAEMPPSLLPPLAQHPDLLHAYVGKVYEKVHSDISQLVIEYAVAQSNDPTLLPESGGIKVVIEAAPEGYANVRLLLERYGVPLTYPDFGDLGSFDGTQIIPPGLVIPVSELTGVTYVNLPPIEVEKIPRNRNIWSFNLNLRGEQPRFTERGHGTLLALMVPVYVFDIRRACRILPPFAGAQPGSERMHYAPPHHRPATCPADNRCGVHCPVPGGACLRAIRAGRAGRCWRPGVRDRSCRCGYRHPCPYPHLASRVEPAGQRRDGKAGHY